ncbi:MAG: hypothetical protein HQL12_06965 [Candidatus Omnitrophica bacterium]|nr:hypothetical protein [Candidatus Omnitrophota bacterium]
MSDLDKINSQSGSKNFDFTNFSQALSTNPEPFVKLFLAAGALIIIGYMFNDYHAKDQRLHARMSQEQEKLEVVSAHDTAVMNLNNFKSSLPAKLSDYKIITLISDYAKSRHVIITSLSPAESKDMGLYNVVNVSFNATCDDFKEMMLFLRKIEKSEFPLKINSWSGNEAENGRINFVVEISGVIFHI